MFLMVPHYLDFVILYNADSEAQPLKVYFLLTVAIFKHSQKCIKKLTSKVMCELKKEQYDFKSVNFECKMVFLTQYGGKVDFTRLFFHRVYTDSIRRS